MQDQRHDRPPSQPSASDNMTARIQSLRSILSHPDRHTTAEQQVALRALDREEQDRRQEFAENLNAMRNTVTTEANDDGLFDTQPSTSPSSIVRTRRSAWRTRERLASQRSRMDRLSRDDPAERSMPMTSRLSPLNTARTRPSSADDEENAPTRDGRYPKRRKLDDGTSDDGLCLPNYGLEGTLRPGNLTMKVLDLGTHNDTISQDDERAKLKLYQASNKDVFRSKKHKYSIAMKHQGGWPFTLSHLVIKLPKHDYDASPLQGMVFIGMSDDIIDSAAYYDFVFPAGYVAHRRRTYDNYRPSHEYMHSTRSPMRALFNRPRQPPDPAESQWCDPRGDIDGPLDMSPSNPGIHAVVDRLPLDSEDSPTSTSPRSPRPWHDPDFEYARRYTRDSYRPNYAASDFHARRREVEVAAAAADATLSDSTTTNSEDEEPPPYRGIPPSRLGLEEAEYRQRSVLEQMRARRDRGEAISYQASQQHAPPWAWPHRPDDDGPSLINQLRRDAELSTTAAASGTASSPRATWAGNGPGTPMSPNQHPTTSTKRLPGPNEMLQGRSANDEPDPHPERIMPHATFQISRDTGAGAVVNFEPHVAGKYILVKLWTQCPNGSVVIQNIVPYGYAGLRQIPDLEFR